MTLQLIAPTEKGQPLLILCKALRHVDTLATMIRNHLSADPNAKVEIITRPEEITTELHNTSHADDTAISILRVRANPPAIINAITSLNIQAPTILGINITGFHEASKQILKLAK